MIPHRAVLFLSASACLLSACGGTDPEPPPPTPAKIRTTYRVLSGISMGGIGTAALGLQHPERFDGVAIMGGPLDAALILRTIDQFHLGGFCSRAELEALLAQGPEKLNDPALIDACAHKATPITWEHAQDFNHWVYTSNGGTFDRSSYLNLFTDLTLAYGNLLYENPASPYAPPGVDVERLRHPPSDFCTNPVTVKGLKNLEYNADGKYDAITFCDGQQKVWYCRNDLSIVDFCSDPANKVTPLPEAQESAFAQTYCAAKGGAAVGDKKEQPLLMLNNAGKLDACRERTGPLTVALALDMNGNGRRDYGEPILNNGLERFDDVGVDGCADEFENGQGGCNATATAGAQDPNKDNYDADTQPLGTERNWLHDDGEPFRDDGLDGVAGTGDFGEGNGAYDVSSGRKHLFEYDARTNYKKLDDAGRARLDVMADGGIRDLFNFGLSAKLVFSLVKHFRPDQSAAYRDFSEIPGMFDERTQSFSPWGKRWTTVSSNLAVLFGKEEPTDQDRIDGEGDHVGTTEEAVNRMYTLFNWTAARWPTLAKPKTGYGDKTLIDTFDSAALGAKRDFGVYLPPGYDAPENKDTRYPVLFMLHGYGMDPQGFLASALPAGLQMSGDTPKIRPFIIVFPNGRCCFVNEATGERDCREQDESGTYIGDKPGFERECKSGSFYVNRHGYTSADARPYGDAFFELMDVVDQRYRTLQTTEVEAR